MKTDDAVDDVQPKTAQAVHQFWGGPAEMPSHIKAACESVQAWALSRGWHYHLWSADELQARFHDEVETRILARCYEVMPSPSVAGLSGDWWRWRLTAAEGGIWLDVDYQVRDTTRLNAWQPAADIALMGEGWQPALPSIGCIWCRGARGKEAAGAIRRTTGNALRRLLPLDAADFQLRLVQLARVDTCFSGIALRGIGPQRMRSEGLPALTAKGYRWEVMPLDVCCDRAVGANPALLHLGASTWRELEADWQGRARQAMQTRAAWLQPQCRNMAASTHHPKRHLQRPHMPAPSDGFRIPDWIKRVVIFSNIPQLDKGRVDLKAGDFCIHCNRAIHFAAVKATSGVTHGLLVRHGFDVASGELQWFEPQSTTGMHQIIHVDEPGMEARHPWWRAYRAATGKCPSTGFIAWHLAQMAAGPSIPIILAGFAPSRSLGTPRWPGHAWDYEAEAYRKAGAQIIAP